MRQKNYGICSRNLKDMGKIKSVILSINETDKYSENGKKTNDIAHNKIVYCKKCLYYNY